MLAKQQPAAFEVVKLKGAVLSGLLGDWLVEYAPGDQGIVAQAIFAATYAPVDSQS